MILYFLFCKYVKHLYLRSPFSIKFIKTLNILTMSKVRITQVKSAIDRPLSQKNTLKALGIQKLNRPVEVQTNEALQGMIEKVKHLLKVEVI